MRVTCPLSRIKWTRKMAMRPVIQWFALTVALHVPLALAQSNLGELLDAGAQPLSVEDFRVGRSAAWDPGARVSRSSIWQTGAYTVSA